MDLYTDITSAIYNICKEVSDIFHQLGLPFGPYAWFVIIYSIPVWLIIFYLAFRLRRGGGSAGSLEGVKTIIASTGDVSAGLAGTKKVSFIKNPSDALVFLRIEENAIQQAIAAVDYYEKQGEIDESLKEKMTSLYQDRLAAVRTAMAKDEALKELVDTESAVDRARSDYLRKLTAMSGTQVEVDTESGPPSVGTPGAVSSGAPAAGPPSGAPPSGGAPGGGPPSGGPPGGGPPSGGPPSGGPSGGAAPAAGPPSGAPPSGGPSGGAAPAGPPSGAPPSGGPSGGAAPAGPPGGEAPSSDTAPAAGPPSGSPGGGKSSLQSEMLAEMERLKSLMSGD
jgi:hypothetical protein